MSKSIIIRFYHVLLFKPLYFQLSDTLICVTLTTVQFLLPQNHHQHPHACHQINILNHVSMSDTLKRVPICHFCVSTSLFFSVHILHLQSRDNGDRRKTVCHKLIISFSVFFLLVIYKIVAFSVIFSSLELLLTTAI